MKNFLIIVLAVSLAGAAYMTRPDREEFDRYVQKRVKVQSTGPFNGLLGHKSADVSTKDVEFKDFYLWTVVRKDGKTLFTGAFDHWIDNEMIRQTLPHNSASGVTPTAAVVPSN